MFVFLIAIIVLALLFDYINGFHDAANSIATIVSTKVLSPFQAVMWAAAFNFIAFFIFREHKVAGTIANIMSENIINFKTIIAATIAAISWDILTWYYGIPSSSSHTLIGGLAGAALAAGGLAGVNTHPIFIALIFMVLSPIIGLLFGFAITVITVNIAKRSRPTKAEKWFRRL
ncbi:MAG TPA: inorganic phosphate transporter, partial [Hanamia sp.]|nr:inorganic phosphate transporter [Hanamia sp.]